MWLLHFLSLLVYVHYYITGQIWLFAFVVTYLCMDAISCSIKCNYLFHGTISVLCDGYIVPSCFWLFAYQDMQHPEENFKNKSSFHHHWKRKLWESKWFSYRMLPLMFHTLEGDRKLCSEFKFSYIGNTGRENFCSWFSFVLCEEIWAYVYLCKS